MYKYIVFLLLVVSFAQSESISVNKHDTFADGFSNIVEFTKDEDINEIRVFLKDSASKTYELYVKTKCVNFNCYAKLPVNDSKLLNLDYTIVYRNVDGYIHKTDDYTMSKEDLLLLPKWQGKYKKEKVVLYSEFEIVPTYVKGFGSNLVVLPTLEENVFGIDVGLYFSIKNGPKKVEHKCPKCENTILKEANDNYVVSDFFIDIIEAIDGAVKEIFK